MYDEKLFTLSTGFSTSKFLIFLCRNSSYYRISEVFRTLPSSILIFTQYPVDVYTQYVCTDKICRKNAGEKFAPAFFDQMVSPRMDLVA